MAFVKKQYLIYDTFAELPNAITVLKGLLAYAKDTNEFYKCTGVAWVALGGGAGGSGDMEKSTYDTDTDDVIDKAESLTLTTVEVDLGTTPKTGGKFNITGVGLTTGKAVFITQANGPYTDKGTLADEAEMDRLSVSGKVTTTVNIECYWRSQHAVRGNFKFDYFVSA